MVLDIAIHPCSKGRGVTALLKGWAAICTLSSWHGSQETAEKWQPAEFGVLLLHVCKSWCVSSLSSHCHMLPLNYRILLMINYCYGSDFNQGTQCACWGLVGWLYAYTEEETASCPISFCSFPHNVGLTSGPTTPKPPPHPPPFPTRTGLWLNINCRYWITQTYSLHAIKGKLVREGFNILNWTGPWSLVGARQWQCKFQLQP